VRAYEAEESIEARLAHDADTLETLLQAREYEAQGNHDTVQWQESSTASLRTDAAQELADAILATTATTRWSAVARSYPQPPHPRAPQAPSRTPRPPPAPASGARGRVARPIQRRCYQAQAVARSRRSPPPYPWSVRSCTSCRPRMPIASPRAPASR